MDYTKIFAEFLGTFIFLFVILKSISLTTNTPGIQPFIIVSGLLVAIFMFGSLTGGHFNPAISFMMYLRGDPNVGTILGLLAYVVAQLAGGALAHYAQSSIFI